MSCLWCFTSFWFYILGYASLADGQADSIVTDIENMVRSYIEKVKKPDLVKNLDGGFLAAHM